MNNVRRTAVVAVFMAGAAIFGAMSLNWLGAVPLGRKAPRARGGGPSGQQPAPGLLAAEGQAAPTVELGYFTHDGQSDVYVRHPGPTGQPGQWVNLTRFTRAQNVFAYAASGDGRWACCWHQDRGPRQLSIYDLNTRARSGHCVPGAAGDLRWTEQGTIFHRWGAGTNAQCFAIYDVRGQTLFEGQASGLELSPTGRFLATFPTTTGADEPLAVYDVVTGKTLFSSAGKYDLREVIGNVWAGPRQLRVSYRDRAGAEKSFTVELR